MSNQLFNGSICLTDILESAKKKHSAFSKGNNGKIYFNVSIWLNEEKDKFGNSMSLQLYSKKDIREKEGKVYIGNAKKSELSEAPISNNDLEDLNSVVDDLPF